jgi:hypothetical protein
VIDRLARLDGVRSATASGTEARGTTIRACVGGVVVRVAFAALRGANCIIEGREVAVAGARAVVLGGVRLPTRFLRVS